MATFHALGCSDLTITVDDLGMMTIFKHFLCAMFTFQLGSLHISKDVSYDYNNFFSSSLYHIPTTSSQGRQWVVKCGCYRIVGDSLAHNSWEIILIIGIVGFIVKINVKQELKVDDTFLQRFDALAYFVFIQLSNSSSGEDLTPFFSLSELSKDIIQFDASLSSKSSTPMGSIQFVVTCLRMMVLLRQTSNELQTLDYDKIRLQKV